MIYSCFDDRRGLYRYFRTEENLPINADLPVPKLPAPTGDVGVPSILSGRPLPSGAKLVGHGWHARGIVVQCGGESLGGLGSFGSEGMGGGLWLFAGVASVAALGLYAWRKHKR